MSVAEGKKMHALARRLFPVCRSLTGEGVRRTLRILRETVPLKIREIPTGTEVFDWRVPREWNIRDAWVKGPDGRKLLDFKRSNLHVVGYSVPFKGRLPLRKLKKRIHTLPSQPGVIPYVTSYYEERWGFCMAHRDFKKLKPGTYEVAIDSTLRKGSLTYADLLIPGALKDEILISTYVCHPSLANNELSGPVVAAHLARRVAKWSRRRYTYRFVFAPETIGAVAYLSSRLEHLKKRVRAGYVVTCAGDPGAFSYLKTRRGDAWVDRATLRTLKASGKKYKVYDYLARGSDERQYGSPGVDLPVGSLMRTKYGEYPQYHTSADDLSFITPRGLGGSLAMYEACLRTLEEDLVYESVLPCEPQMGRRGLRPTLSVKGGPGTDAMAMMDLLAYCDGKTELPRVAELIRRPEPVLRPLVRRLEKAGLLRRR